MGAPENKGAKTNKGDDKVDHIYLVNDTLPHFGSLPDHNINIDYTFAMPTHVSIFQTCSGCTVCPSRRVQELEDQFSSITLQVEVMVLQRRTVNHLYNLK